MARDQFGLGEAADAGEVIRGDREFEDVQRALDFLQQARHLGQLRMVPVGFDEGDEGLARVGEIGDGLAHEHIEHLARFAGDDVFGAGLGTEPRDLVVERGVDEQQRAGDVEQRAFLGRALAGHDRVQRAFLFGDQMPRVAQAEHAERVGNAAEGFHLRLQFRDIAVAGAQVQVERVLDPQQVFLQRRGDGVQQGAVAPADAAARVLELFGGRRGRVEVEGPAQFLQCGMIAGLRRVVEQLPRRLERRVGATDLQLVAIELVARLALDPAEGLAQARAGQYRASLQRAHHRRGDPEHALRGFVARMADEPFGRGGERVRIGGRARIGPLRQRVGEARELRLRGIVGGGGARGGRQWAVQVGREQHAFVEARGAARRAQFVEQRQQHDRNIAMPALQAFEVIGQQHHATHQRGAGFVAIARLAVGERRRQRFHFLADHRRRVQLEHAQAALHLMQERGAGVHAAGVARILGVGLDLQPRLAQGLVELRLDPAERGEIDRVAKRSRHRLALGIGAWGRRPEARDEFPARAANPRIAMPLRKVLVASGSLPTLISA